MSQWGATFGVLDRANPRSSHDGVVPKGGGVGILAAFIFSVIFHDLPALFWVPIALVALISLYGDKVDLSPKIRLSIQFLAAFVLLSVAFPVFPVVSDFRLPTSNLCLLPSFLCLLFLSVFIVGTANYFNFMDGINGIAGIAGLVGFGLLGVFAGLPGGNEAYLMLAVCMGFACLGFLPFNLLKARVFMGDVGSILLGFVYAGLVVVLSNNLNDFVVLCAFLFPFYADELTTEYIRLRDGENLLKPHRRHLYQLLANEMGIAHWKVSVGYGILQLLVGVSVLVVRQVGILGNVVLLGAWFGGFVWVSFYFRRKLATDPDKSEQTFGRTTPVK